MLSKKLPLKVMIADACKYALWGGGKNLDYVNLLKGGKKKKVSGRWEIWGARGMGK